MRILLPLLMASLTLALQVYASDVYPSYSALARNEKEGLAYRIEVKDQKSPITLIAIHGGRIEEGSDTLAKDIARNDFNFYAFIATKAKDNHALHVTSSHYDEPRALTLIRGSQVVVSIHGFKGTDQDEICLGGRNEILRREMAKAIGAMDKKVLLTERCPSREGTDPQNLVNLAGKPGVQLELSHHLRSRLRKDSKLNASLVGAVRSVLLLLSFK